MLRRIFSIFISLHFTGSALADEPERRGPPPDDNGWSLYVGGGGFYAPNWSGDDEYSAAAVPFIRVTKGDRFFASVQEGMGYAIINDNGFRAGPLAAIDFGRDEDGNNPFRISGGESADLIGLGNISTTVALGGFVDYKVGDIKIKAKGGRALGAHEGLTAELGVDFDKTIMSVGPPLFVAIGPRLKWADDSYNQAFYGITTTQSIASGLSVYGADDGLISYGVGGSVLMPLSYTMGITVFGSYDHLTGPAGDSPLVRERGSRDQFFGGAAIAYKF